MELMCRQDKPTETAESIARRKAQILASTTRRVVVRSSRLHKLSKPPNRPNRRSNITRGVEEVVPKGSSNNRKGQP